MIRYLHLGLCVSADFIGLGGEHLPQLVIGVLLVKFTLQGLVTLRHQFHSLKRERKIKANINCIHLMIERLHRSSSLHNPTNKISKCEMRNHLPDGEEKKIPPLLCLP